MTFTIMMTATILSSFSLFVSAETIVDYYCWLVWCEKNTVLAYNLRSFTTKRTGCLSVALIELPTPTCLGLKALLLQQLLLLA